MTKEQAAAYIYAMAVSAMAEIEAMKALNAHRLSLGQSIAYDDAAFLAIPDKYGIHHNAVIGLFQEVNNR